MPRVVADVILLDEGRGVGIQPGWICLQHFVDLLATHIIRIPRQAAKSWHRFAINCVRSMPRLSGENTGSVGNPDGVVTFGHKHSVKHSMSGRNGGSTTRFTASSISEDNYLTRTTQTVIGAKVRRRVTGLSSRRGQYLAGAMRFVEFLFLLALATGFIVIGRFGFRKDFGRWIVLEESRPCGGMRTPGRMASALSARGNGTNNPGVPAASPLAFELPFKSRLLDHDPGDPPRDVPPMPIGPELLDHRQPGLPSMARAWCTARRSGGLFLEAEPATRSQSVRAPRRGRCRAAARPARSPCTGRPSSIARWRGS